MDGAALRPPRKHQDAGRIQLPNGDQAHVPVAKLLTCMLSDTHPVGKSKARLLRGIGFSEATVRLLVDQLLEIAHSAEVDEAITTPFGVMYALHGTVEGPIGQRVELRTVWVAETGSERSRFVTAYPSRSGRSGRR